MFQQAKAEQEEEYISNTLLKKIQALKKEKETLAHHYEREEECLTNDLSRKLDQLRQEKCKLELTLEQEQECLVNKLMRKIEKLEAETSAKQNHLEQLRREMVELENTLEQEQEALVNKLWKRMDKLEAEKRSLQIKLDQPVSDPTSPKWVLLFLGELIGDFRLYAYTVIRYFLLANHAVVLFAFYHILSGSRWNLLARISSTWAGYFWHKDVWHKNFFNKHWTTSALPIIKRPSLRHVKKPYPNACDSCLIIFLFLQRN